MHITTPQDDPYICIYIDFLGVVEVCICHDEEAAGYLEVLRKIVEQKNHNEYLFPV